MLACSRPALAVLGSLLLWACAPAGLVPAVGVTVRGVVAPLASRSLLVVPTSVTAYSLDRLDYVTVAVRDLTAGGAARDIGQLDAIGTGASGRTFPAVELRHLEPRHHYEATLRGYLSNTQVSVDVNSVTAFDTDGVNAGAIELVTLTSGFKLTLEAKTYAGQASGYLDIAEGLTDAGDSLAVVFPTPMPTATPSPEI